MNKETDSIEQTAPVVVGVKGRRDGGSDVVRVVGPEEYLREMGHWEEEGAKAGGSKKFQESHDGHSPHMMALRVLVGLENREE